MSETNIAPLLTGADLRLRRRCRIIGRMSRDTKDLFERLLATMRAAPGVGLAAPQIGDMRRACVVEADDLLLLMANPVVIHASREMILSEEGCLSFPGIVHRVIRHRAVRVRFLSYAGKLEEIALGGLAAIAAQHEIDHLDGILMHMRAHDARAFVAEEAREPDTRGVSESKS